MRLVYTLNAGTNNLHTPGRRLRLFIFLKNVEHSPGPLQYYINAALISFLRTLVFQVSAVLILPTIWGIVGN